jgi:hypothetical protein
VRKDGSYYNSYNLSNPIGIKFHEYITYLNQFGYRIKLTDPKIWREEHLHAIDATNAIYPFKFLYMQDLRSAKYSSHALTISNINDTQAILNDLKIIYPSDYKQLLSCDLNFLWKLDYLPPLKS